MKVSLRSPRLLRIVLVALVGALAVVLTWPSAHHPNETLAQHLATLQHQVDVLQKQPPTSCPAEYAALATAPEWRVSMFYGYANFDDFILDGRFADAMSSVLQLPCRGAMAACDFTLARKDANAIELKRTIRERPVTVDIEWTSVSDDGRYIRGAGAKKQADQSAAIKAHFYRALQESDVVLYTGHSRGGGGLGFDPSSKLDIALEVLVRSPAKAIATAMRARPSRLKLLSAMACDSDKYYSDELHAANPDVALLLVDGNISTTQTDQLDLGLLNSILGERCAAQRDESLRSVDEPGVKVRWRR